MLGQKRLYPAIKVLGFIVAAVVVAIFIAVIGCGGGKSGVTQYSSAEELLYSLLPERPSGEPGRGRGDACIWVVTYGNNQKALWIQDMDNIQSVTVTWLFPDKKSGQARYYPNSELPCFVAFQLPYYGQAQYAIAVVNPPGSVDSTWKIDLSGRLSRIWPSGSPNCPSNPPNQPECASPPPSPPEFP
jgi:hypothetical protein